MRALCGAIITAGALIGLGLTALGFGVRYQGAGENPATKMQFGAPTMTYLLAFIFCGLLIGLGVAFVGLMYHHERRHRESLRELGRHSEMRT
jgi:ABC-type uncharacterized transport system permease subunit